MRKWLTNFDGNDFKSLVLKPSISELDFEVND
jgi:hypothetical protein